MNTRTQIVLVMLGIALILGYGFAPSLTPAQDKASARGKWEYKIAKIAATQGAITIGGLTRTGMVPGTMSEANLNDLGEQGWELFKITGGQHFVTGSEMLPGPGSKTANTIGYSDTVYYFKRPK